MDWVLVHVVQPQGNKWQWLSRLRRDRGRKEEGPLGRQAHLSSALLDPGMADTRVFPEPWLVLRGKTGIRSSQDISPWESLFTRHNFCFARKKKNEDFLKSTSRGCDVAGMGEPQELGFPQPF